MMILLRRKSVNKQPNIQTFLTVELSVGLSQNQVVVPPYSNLIWQLLWEFNDSVIDEQLGVLKTYKRLAQ